MPRLMLTDKLWLKLKSILLEDRVYNKLEHRQTMEGILYRLRVGCPWRDLPECFGLWNTIYRRFLLWSKKGILIRLFKSLSANSDTEWEFIDGSYVKAHQHSTGAASQQEQAIALSRGGNTSKIHLAVDSYGLLIELLPQGDFVIADKGYNSEVIRNKVRERNSKTGNGDIDWCLYKYRHLVENAFARLKHFRAIATRYDKLKLQFESMLALACAMIWLPM